MDTPRPPAKQPKTLVEPKEKPARSHFERNEMNRRAGRLLWFHVRVQGMLSHDGQANHADDGLAVPEVVRRQPWHVPRNRRGVRPNWKVRTAAFNRLLKLMEKQAAHPLQAGSTATP